MTDLACVATRQVGPTQVTTVTGEIDLSNARVLLDAVAAGLPDGASLLVLDLTATTYLDSAAVAALFRLAERLRARRQELRLVVPADSPVRAVLRLTRLDHVIQVDDSPPDPA